MEKYFATPQLEFMEAVQLAWSRLFDFKGRSRRSEFWWFLLAYWVCYFFVNLLLGIFLPYLTATIVGCLIMILIVGVTIRRLQDGGHSKWWVILSFILLSTYNIYIAQSDMMFELMSINPNADVIVKEMSSPFMVFLSLANMVLSITIFVFCLIDGKPGPNKYGESPKYKLKMED